MSGWRKGYAVTCIGLTDNRYEERASRELGCRCPSCGARVLGRCIKCEGPFCPRIKTTGRVPGTRIARKSQTLPGGEDPIALLATVEAAGVIEFLQLLETLGATTTRVRNRWRCRLHRFLKAGWLVRTSVGIKITAAGRRELASAREAVA